MQILESSGVSQYKVRIINCRETFHSATASHADILGRCMTMRKRQHIAHLSGSSPKTVVSTCMAFRASPFGFSEKSVMRPVSSIFMSPKA